MDKRVITIFGGSGFLGRHTVRAFAQRGFRIRVAVRRPDRAFHLPPMGQVGQIQLVKANVAQLDQVEQAVSGAYAVVNLTGILFQRGDQTFDSIHADAAENIATASRRAGAKALTHVSAIGADPKSESRYAQSKAAGEDRVRDAFPDATILRPSILFGPQDQFFNRFAGLARFSPFLPLIGGGLTKFQPAFVGDVAEALTRTTANSDGISGGQTFELGGPNIYTFKELMQFILRETNRKRVLLPIPYAVATLKSFVLQFFPNPLLTPDQVRLLRHDNVVSGDARTFESLGITPTSIEAEVPAYLWRFRPKGQYEREAAAFPPRA